MVSQITAGLAALHLRRTVILRRSHPACLGPRPRVARTSCRCDQVLLVDQLRVPAPQTFVSAGPRAHAARDRALRAIACFLCACFLVTTAWAGEQTERKIIEQLVNEADAGRPTSELVEAAKEQGIASALAAAEFLDEQKPARAQALYEVISLTANCRRWQPEILRLYQPEAYRVFHTPEGQDTEQRLAQGFAWKTWPAALPEAVVRAAPQPTIEWLSEQSLSKAPDFAKLRALLKPLGYWLRSYSERTEAGAFRRVLCELSANRAIMSDVPTGAMVLRTIGDAKALRAIDFVLPQTHAASAELRAAAVEAMGQLVARATREGDLAQTLDAERTQALPELIRLAHEERDSAVLAKLATAAEAWLDEPRMGQAMLDLFERSEDALTQRNILFAVSKTRWPQRGAIIQRGLSSAANGVAGVALEAVGAHPLPELAPAVLAMLEAQKEAQPNLIDAAGALGDVRALPVLLRWLEQERNLALQLKLTSALQNIPAEASGAALAKLLATSADPVLVEHLCRIASARELVGAVPTLCALAEDTTAPLTIRGQASWALGRYRELAARECLERLSRAPEKYFPTTGLTLLPESLEQARLSIVLARWRQGNEELAPTVTQLYASGTPGVKLNCLLALAEIGRDHPIIETALGATDFPVLLGGVRAAGAAAPAKYLPRLRALRASPFIDSLSASGLDTWRLPIALENAIQAAAKPASIP